MDSCGCPENFASIFDRRHVRRDLARYRRRGPDRTTRMLLDMLRPFREPGATLIDIGGGIGAIDQAFLRDGAARAVLVDGSPEYQAAARAEAERAHTLDRLRLLQGDFVRRAPELEPADVVTLDRVLCCYPDAERLVGLSAARARRAYGLVLPRDRWLFRVGARMINTWFRLRRNGYRAFAHRNHAIDGYVAAAGLRPASEARTFFWRVVVYHRTPAAAASPQGAPA